jgi:hypothetical protein
MKADTDTVVDQERFPHDPLLPKGDVLIDIFSRLSSMSDALHDPDGLLQTVLREQDRKNSLRHMAMMNMLRKVLDEILEVKSQLETAKEDIEVHGAQLTMLHTEIQ